MSDKNVLGFDVEEVVRRVIKYLIEGLAVAVAAYYIPKKGRMKLSEVVMIGVTAASVFAVLDLASPTIADNARLGAGFGIGYKMV